MELITVTEFIAKGTVKIWAYNEDEDGDLADPGATIRVIVKDKDGVQKAGYISVSSSTTFTAALTVTGATSGATGYVISKPDSTTLELARCTGVWESGETIEDTGSGTSSTTSALLGADMTQYEIDAVPQTGIYYYYFRTTTESTKGRYQVEVEVIDGSSTTAISSIGTIGFKVK